MANVRWLLNCAFALTQIFVIANGEDGYRYSIPRIQLQYPTNKVEIRDERIDCRDYITATEAPAPERIVERVPFIPEEHKRRDEELREMIVTQREKIDDHQTKIDNSEKIIREQKETIEDVTREVKEKDRTIGDLGNRIDDQRRTLENQQRKITEQTDTIRENNREIKNRDQTIDDQNNTIDDQTKVIKRQDREIREQVEIITERNREIKERDKTIGDLGNRIDDQRRTIEDQERKITETEEIIRERVQDIQDRNDVINDQKIQLENQKRTITDQDRDIKEQADAIRDRDREIEDRDKIIVTRDETIEMLVEELRRLRGAPNLGVVLGDKIIEFIEMEKVKVASGGVSGDVQVSQRRTQQRITTTAEVGSEDSPSTRESTRSRFSSSSSSSGSGSSGTSGSADVENEVSFGNLGDLEFPSGSTLFTTRIPFGSQSRNSNRKFESSSGSSSSSGRISSASVNRPSTVYGPPKPLTASESRPYKSVTSLKERTRTSTTTSRVNRNVFGHTLPQHTPPIVVTPKKNTDSRSSPKFRNIRTTGYRSYLIVPTTAG